MRNCTKCSLLYEKIDRDCMDYIKNDMTRRLKETTDKSQPSIPIADNENEHVNDLDKDMNDTMLENHCYHLSWAIFKHLPCNYFYY